jgi:hypothetical protein
MYKSSKDPLQPILGFEPFMKRGLDFMGLIEPPAHCIKHQYIIITTYYTSKWVEAKTSHDNTTRKTIKFIYKNIITWFSCLTHLVNDQRSHFTINYIELLVQEFMTINHKSTTYYLQGNSST